MNSAAPSKAIIDLNAYTHNLAVVRRFIGHDAAIAAVLKANAYGHGLVPLAKKAVDAGVRMLAVAIVNEGIQLRQAGIQTPILIMVQPDDDTLEEVLEYHLTPMISTTKTAERLGELAHRANRMASIHCKVDSGMGRQGFSLSTAPSDLQYLSRISHIDIEGIATHFPIADQLDDTFTYNQIKTFKQLLKQLDKRGIPYEIAHAANSAAIVNYQGSIFNMVRPGLMTYGVWPAKNPPPQNLLKPVLRWETRVLQIRNLEPGASVGYGRTYKTDSPIRAAVLPVGYADGYKYNLSNNADVLIRGKRCPVRGSVCMDQIVVDVSHLEDVQTGDLATLIGTDGAESIPVEELAERAKTIPYDILTGIGQRVPREYIE
ncbi:MAG TPA: alanine racemase [Candidatus Hydrogenedentes bacterium]|nr:alanine racemase [Candidatus Hydrogenedentota bacterium]